MEHWEDFLEKEMKQEIKIFRHLRKNHSRKTGTFESVSDVLKMHWLYCSFKLKTLSEVARRKYKCSICKQNGHNCNTCPSAPKQSSICTKFLNYLYTQSIYTAAIVAVIYTCLQTINHSLLYLYTYLTIYSFIYLFIYLLKYKSLLFTSQGLFYICWK